MHANLGTWCGKKGTWCRGVRLSSSIPDTMPQAAEEGTMSLQSLLENVLGKRFSKDAAWNDPEFLKQEFSRDQLGDGLAHLSRTHRKRNVSPTEWTSIYSTEEYDEARSLMQTAKAMHPRFRKLPAGAAAEQGEGKILARGSGTPQSFHGELQRERREREKEDGRGL